MAASHLRAVRVFAAVAFACALAVPAAAQRNDDPAPLRPAGYLSTRTAFVNETLASLRTGGGVAQPRGMLYVQWLPGTGFAPSTSFSESNVPEAAFDRVRAPMARLLEAAPGEPVRFSTRLERWPADVVMDVAQMDALPRLNNWFRIRQITDAMLAEKAPMVREIVRLALLVNARGEVAAVEVEQLSGDPVIDRYLHAMAYEMRFRPARIGGQPVASWVVYQLSFFT